jgi:hypothetical protein
VLGTPGLPPTGRAETGQNASDLHEPLRKG